MSDVIVVGAGLIGLTTAWRTAQAGATVTLLDDEPERAASRVAAGMLAPSSELNYGESALFRLGTVASRGYPDFVAELMNISGIDVDYRQRGTVSVALDNDDHRALAEIFDYAALQGAKVHKLRGRDCRRHEPGLSPGVRGGWLVETDHQVDPRRLLRSLEVAAQRAGVRRLTASAARLHSRRDRVTGVETESGDLLNTDAVVVAAGCWSTRIEGVPISARPPVRPIKGQLLRLRTPTGFPTLNHTVRGLVHGAPVYLVPRSDGELILGATSEEQGFDRKTTLEAIYSLVRDARLLFPGVTELELVEISTGLRPGSPDNAPIIGERGPRGLWWATGHYRNGALLAPVTGAAIARMLRNGSTPDEFAPFSPDRFSAGAETLGV